MNVTKGVRKMNIKRFRTVAKVSSILLKIAAVFLMGILLYTMYLVFISDADMWMTYSSPSFSLFHSVSGGLQTMETDLQTVAAIFAPIAVLINIFVLWKGSQLFKRLADGEKPFTDKFAQSIKWLSLVLIISDILLPLFYSLIITLMTENGHYLIIGVGAPFLIGLILYAVAGIFYYGIELQTLSDETV